VSVNWGFLAHHFRHDLRNWKRFSETGGGAIRFYGIQIIALLAEAGYRDVSLSSAFGASPDEVEKWIAAFSGPGLPECNIVLDTRASANEFRVEQTPGSNGGQKGIFADLGDPFDSDGGTRDSNENDRRVLLLGLMCRSLLEEGVDVPDWYDATIRLWRKTEAETQFEAS
jgi:hypothetical protein